MSKVNPIHLSYKGTEYTLEFNRKTAQALERAGFDGNLLDSKPNMMIPLLYSGAFRMHHPYLKQDIIDEIYDQIPKKSKFIEKLAELYNEPIMALLTEPEGESGNVNWE